jgi:hypothetical protein
MFDSVPAQSELRGATAGTESDVLARLIKH